MADVLPGPGSKRLTPLQPRPKRFTLKGLATWAWNSWATRSLAIGAIATAIDIGVGLGIIFLFERLNHDGLQLLAGVTIDEYLWTRAGAMLGVAVGAAFTFFANRHFAFKEHNPKLASPALKFLIATGLAMLVHGQLVVLLNMRLHVPFVAAKMIADIGVFSIGQLLLLRYLVFPKKKEPALEPPVPLNAKSLDEPAPEKRYQVP
jgi:hypothetical protein